MYHLNQQLPAPYELNQPAPQPPQAFARGGRAGKMTIAHFNPKELHVLDHLQGKEERCPRSGLRSYSHLEELLKNPHILHNVHHHAREHHADGGAAGVNHEELEHLKSGGRLGDTELGLIGPHTHRLFDELAGHKTHNPNDGHPEYWSLGNALGGLWNTVKGVASKALPALMPMAQNFLGGQGKFGQMASQALGAAAPMIQQRLGDQSHNPIGQAIGSGLGQMAQSRQGGSSWGQSAGHGMAQTGRGLGGSPLGEAMQGAGESMGRGEGMGQAMRQGASRGFDRAGGMQGLGQMAQNVMQQRGQGVPGMRAAARQQARQYAGQMMPNQQGMQRQNLWDQANDQDNF